MKLTHTTYTSKNGDSQRVCDMNSVHLFNALRKVFNHSVPPAFRIGPFIRDWDWAGAPLGNGNYAVLYALLTECLKRYKADDPEITQNLAELHDLAWNLGTVEVLLDIDSDEYNIACEQELSS